MFAISRSLGRWNASPVRTDDTIQHCRLCSLRQRGPDPRRSELAPNAPVFCRLICEASSFRNTYPRFRHPEKQ
jgi:hypothetical protein